MQDQSNSDLSRRSFLEVGAATVAVGVARSAGAQFHDPQESSAVVIENLGGGHWRVEDASAHGPSIAAQVPGDIFTDLMRAKLIDDPYYRENNAKVQWVGKRAWRYTSQFKPSAAILSRRNVVLRCRGLDTLARVTLNGNVIGRADNMYRTWEFDVRRHLRPGVNTIEVIFYPTAPYAAKRVKKYHKHPLIKRLKAPQTWVRKAPYMWGWDWCRPLLTCGIWKPMELVGYDSRITEMRIDQHLETGGSAELDITVAIEGAPVGGKVALSVRFGDRPVASRDLPISAGRVQARIHIDQPQLWWPNSMGPQNLYSVVAELHDRDGNRIDDVHRRIGLRTIRYRKAESHTSVHLEVNGVAFFAKGADWVPADNIPTRITPEILSRYMHDARDCGFNLLRFWGGGFYEYQEQFDLCDELGLLVLFEFKFANHFYPVFDPHWLENVRREVTEQVRLNRHHPCIAIWSGNNEIYWFHGFNKLFKETIGGILEKEFPGANYELGSGDPGSKIDLHYWGPWNVVDPPTQFRKAHGFITEFGMQSFPQPATVDAYTAPADRDHIYSPVMVYHERSFGKFGMQNMLQEVEQYFGPLPTDFDSKLWLSQIAQAYVIGWGVEYWRRQMPRTMCTLIWQFNDSWPGPTWSMIDWYHRWKAIMYASRRFYAPVLVSTEFDAKSGDAAVWINNDRMTSFRGEVRWDITDAGGHILHRGRQSVDVGPHSARMVQKIPTAALGAHDTPPLIWTQWEADGRVMPGGCYFAVAPKSLGLQNPELTHHVEAAHGDEFQVTVSARRPALWTWLNLKGVGARYSDNFVHLRGDQPCHFAVKPSRAMALQEFRRRLEVRSVYDLLPGGK
jgi:beta-mannosidase